MGMVSHERRGLPCRADVHCAFVAQVLDDLATTLADSVQRRDAHELNAHSYVHVRTEQINYPFTARMTSRGRSTISRKHNPDLRSKGDDAA